jgi:hypothetical protein
MDAIRPFFHEIASGIQLFGMLVVVLGAMRIVRAPAQAAKRASNAVPEGVAVDRERYTRGLVDFYRISGAIQVVVGIVLTLVPVFAG